MSRTCVKHQFWALLSSYDSPPFTRWIFGVYSKFSGYDFCHRTTMKVEAAARLWRAIYFHKGNPSAFSVKLHSRTVSFKLLLIYFATEYTSREDARVRLVNAFMIGIDWVQPLMLRKITLFSALFTAIFGKYCFCKLADDVFQSAFNCGSASFENVLEGVFYSFLRCFKQMSWRFAAYFFRDGTSNLLVNVQIGRKLRADHGWWQLFLSSWGRRRTFVVYRLKSLIHCVNRLTLVVTELSVTFLIIHGMKHQLLVTEENFRLSSRLWRAESDLLAHFLAIFGNHRKAS